jgi:protein TonB
MKKYLLKLIICFFTSHAIIAQVSNSDTTKKSPILKPIMRTTKDHTLKRKKVAKKEVAKSESKKKVETPKKKEEKTVVTKVEKEKKNPPKEKPEPKPKEKKSVAVETPPVKSNTVAAVLPESSVPTFKGGKKAMSNFINQNLIYPNNADKNGIRGTVDFSCTVTKDGKLKDVKMIKALGFGCNEEALRLVKLMPDWEPGRANGQAVDMPAVFSITFR